MLLDRLIDLYIAGWAAVFFRTAGFALWMPFMWGGSVPRRVSVAFVLHASLVLMMGIGAPIIAHPDDMVAWVFLLAPEFLLGAGLGLIVRAVLVAAQGMGQFVSQAIGLAFATFIDPGTGTAMQVVDRLTYLIMGLLLVATDTHLLLFERFVESFVLLPVGQVPATGLNGLEVARWGGMIFEASLRLAAPALAVGFMIYTVLAILARVAPQMNLFAFGFALTIPAGLGALLFSSPYTIALMQDLLGRLPDVLRTFMMGGVL